MIMMIRAINRTRSRRESIQAKGILYAVLDPRPPGKFGFLFFSGSADADAVTFQPNRAVLATIAPVADHHGRPGDFYTTFIAANLVGTPGHCVPPLAW
jgi:hypothetical protein